MNTLFGEVPITRCQNCHRRLTDPKSTRRGFGPKCWARLHPGSIKDADDVEKFYDGMMLETVVQAGAFLLERRSGTPYTNVPHSVVSHSPSGFEWGYGGSGPHDLALNILECALDLLGYKGGRTNCYRGSCSTLAWELHGTFTWEVINGVAEAGKSIPLDVVWGWLQRSRPEEIVCVGGGFAPASSAEIEEEPDDAQEIAA